MERSARASTSSADSAVLGQRDAERGAEPDRLPTDDDRVVERLLEPARQGADRLLVGDGQHDDQLVAPDPADRVLRPQDRGEAVRHLAEDGVPDRVAEIGVDLPEVVEVDVAHDHLAAVPPHPRERLGEAVEQQQLVGQPGVRVGHGQLPELVVLPSPRCATGGLGVAGSELLQHRLHAPAPAARRRARGRLRPLPTARVVRRAGPRVYLVPPKEPLLLSLHPPPPPLRIRNHSYPFRGCRYRAKGHGVPRCCGRIAMGWAPVFPGQGAERRSHGARSAARVETTGLPPACTEDAIGEPDRAALTSTGVHARSGHRPSRTSIRRT